MLLKQKFIIIYFIIIKYVIKTKIYNNIFYYYKICQ